MLLQTASESFATGRRTLLAGLKENTWVLLPSLQNNRNQLSNGPQQLYPASEVKTLRPVCPLNSAPIALLFPFSLLCFI